MVENKSIINWELHYKLIGNKGLKFYKEIKNMKDLGLINYEGDVLKLRRASDNEFVIYDQWDSIVEVLDMENFCSWLDGDFGLIDSKGKEWVFTEHHKDARAPLHIIFEYIK